MADRVEDRELRRELEDLREQQRAISGVLRAVAQSARLQPVLGRVFAAVEERVDTSPVGRLDLKGFGRPVAAYEVRALR